MALTIRDITVLDGGMGSELIAREVLSSEGLWSARALLEAPEAVSQIHHDFIRAGAGVITTNSYSTIPSYLEKEGLSHRFEELTALAANLARAAADQGERDVLVAGCLPPLNESYRFDLVPEDAYSRGIYGRMIEVLSSKVDLYLCETMSCAREAANAAAAARDRDGDKPLWVSWTLHETPGQGLRSGETLEQALDAVTPYSPDAYLFNCTDPEAITGAIATLSTLTEKPIGAYPNLFHVPPGWTLDNDVQTTPREMSVAEFKAYASRWCALGAQIIGGCCGISPKFISAISPAASTGCTG